MMAGYYSSRI